MRAPSAFASNTPSKDQFIDRPYLHAPSTSPCGWSPRSRPARVLSPTPQISRACSHLPHRFLAREAGCRHGPCLHPAPWSVCHRSTRRRVCPERLFFPLPGTSKVRTYFSSPCACPLALFVTSLTFCGPFSARRATRCADRDCASMFWRREQHWHRRRPRSSLCYRLPCVVGWGTLPNCQIRTKLSSCRTPLRCIARGGDPHSQGHSGRFWGLSDTALQQRDMDVETENKARPCEKRSQGCISGSGCLWERFLHLLWRHPITSRLDPPERTSEASQIERFFNVVN